MSDNKMGRDVEFHAEMLAMENVRESMITQLSDVEYELSKSRKTYRPALIEKKNLLLRNLREQNLRIKDAKRKHLDESCADHPITDHAVVRWLERKHGVPIKKLKDAILTDELRGALRQGLDNWSDGEILYFLRKGAVITLIPLDQAYRNGVEAA